MLEQLAEKYVTVALCGWVFFGWMKNSNGIYSIKDSDGHTLLSFYESDVADFRNTFIILRARI